MFEANIVVGLGFGDEGKGLVTDYLCSKKSDSIVIRFSGGQQAGHTVKIGDLKHVHSNFGSGTLRGVPTYITEHCTVFPPTMIKEHCTLVAKGITPKLYIHPLAMITTPADVAYARVMQNGYNTCGLGVGATKARNYENQYKLYAIDLLHPELLMQKNNRIRDYYAKKLIESGNQNLLTWFTEEYLKYLDTFFNYQDIFEIKDYSILQEYSRVIFEGSQGILLDKDHGFFPDVTYSNTTTKYAMKLCKQLQPYSINIYYVTRCYLTRHGEGFIPKPEINDLVNNEEETNIMNRFQGKFITMEIDYSLINYALNIDAIYSGDNKKNMVITCVDQRPDFKFNLDMVNFNESVFVSTSPDSKDVKQLKWYQYL